jgi:putative transposase
VWWADRNFRWSGLVFATRENEKCGWGANELLQRASLMEDSVFDKMMHGITTRRYSAVVKELEQAYGIQKSAISEHFIDASRQRLETLMVRPLKEHAFCGMMIDGTHFGDQQLITFLGITVHGYKVVLGLRQGATENTTVVKQLLDDLQERGVDFEVPRLYILDGGKALSAAVKQKAGKAAFIQRCQIHKVRNVVDHLIEDHKGYVRQKLLSAYRTRDHNDAERALALLHRELMDLNPSAARSLHEGMQESLTIHRLRVPPATSNQFRQYQLDRVGILDRRDRMPQCETLAKRRSAPSVGRQRATLGRVEMEPSAWLP